MSESNSVDAALLFDLEFGSVQQNSNPPNKD